MLEQLQLEQIVRIKIEAFSLDSTSVKVHPDGTGAFKKTDHKPLNWRDIEIGGRERHRYELTPYGCGDFVSAIRIGMPAETAAPSIGKLIRENRS